MTNTAPKDHSLIGWLIVGARPRTLPAAVVPVLVGTAVVADLELGNWWRVGLALIVSMSLQIAVNYANDYSDGVKGTDTDRVGPLRLVGSGALPAKTVKLAAVAMMAVAAVAGLALAAVTSWWILLVGCVAMIATWTYTGGPRPYGYAGFGEVFVFVFFGVVATVGTEFVVSEQITVVSCVASIAVGVFACALLVVNNLRDIHGDKKVGKITLAVKMGDAATRVFFAVLFLVAACCVFVVALLTQWWALLGLVGCVFTVSPIRHVLKQATGPDLIKVLGDVGKAQLIFGVSFALGIFLSV